MHFHLPKPLHGWREFAGEVGIIVVGVLIALGAEQFVERGHWRSEARQATDSLRDEVADHYVTASEIVMAQPCIDQQLETLEQSLLRPGAYIPAPVYQGSVGSFVFRAPTRTWADNVWRTVVSEGIATHLDARLRLKLAAYYAQLDSMRTSNHDADRLGWQLRILSQPLQPDAATRANLMQQIEETRGQFGFMKLVGNQEIGTIEDMGMKPPQGYVANGLAQSGTLQFCKDHHLPLSKVEPERAVIESIHDYDQTATSN
jgi:hypothetical protein